MTAELKISTKLATEMAADVHAAMSKYADNKDITLGTTLMAMVWLTSDLLAHVLLNNPEELREPLISTAQHRAGNDTDVHGSVPGEGRKMRHPGMPGEDRKKTGRKGGGE